RQKARYQRTDGRDRSETLRRDVRLGNGDVELGFNGQHEIDHVQRAETQIAEVLVGRGWDRKGALVENSLDQIGDLVSRRISTSIKHVGDPSKRQTVAVMPGPSISVTP